MIRKNLPLPDLTNKQWQIALTAFACKTDIPVGQMDQDFPNSTGPSAFSWTKLVTAVAIELGLDELPQDDPRVIEMLQPFFDLTEAEAMTVLFVNNMLWETGEALWRPTPAAVVQ